MTTDIATAPPPRKLVERTADRFGVDPARLLPTLKATCFKSSTPASDEQMIALLIVAEQYHLNPFTKELYAYPDKGGIVPVVSVDGWARIINEHPMLDGIDFEYSDAGPNAHVTCILHRKDRTHPTRITEFMSECKRETPPWQKSPRRMLRHKALIQCARIAFGFAGIYDDDEAARIVATGPRVEPTSSAAERVRSAMAPTVDADTGEIEDARQVERQVERAGEPSLGEIEAGLLAEYLLVIGRATDPEAASLVLDEARDTLTPEQHATLADAWRARFQPEEK